MNNMIQKANKMRFYFTSVHYQEIEKQPAMLAHLSQFLSWEEEERTKRRLNSLIKKNGVKTFSHMSYFDWLFPHKINREQIEDLFTLKFVSEKTNIILMGPNGVGKSMIAKNIVQAATQQGLSGLFIESSQLLDELLNHTTRAGLERALNRYMKTQVLAIDEIGYLSYDSRHADMFFQLINRRTSLFPTILTTNRPFSEWPQIFPGSACVTALIDRLIERCELCLIEGDSYRAKRYQDKERFKLSQRKKP